MNKETLHSHQKVRVAYYSYSGNTKRVAQRLREKTPGVLFELETANPYSNRAVIEQAKRELEQGRLPALQRDAPNLALYDLVLVGGPVWWYTVATPVMSFLKDAGFAGKNIAAFCTHEGGFGKYFADFKRQARNAVVLNGLDLFKSRHSQKEALDTSLDAWLGTLGVLEIEPIKSDDAPGYAFGHRAA
jgi:flavodoxin